MVEAVAGRRWSKPIRLFSTLAVRAAVEELLPRFTDAEAVPVDATFDPTSLLSRRIADGDLPDVLIGVSTVLEGLMEPYGPVAEPPTTLARTGVGVAVAPGAKHPDISTVDRLVHALTSARSVAYSRNGASGIYFAGLLDRLGVAAQVNERATVVDKGFTALALVDGRAELAVQMVSELMFVADVEVVGPLPPQAQHYTEFSAAMVAAGAAEPAVRRLVGFLSSPEARESYRHAGLQVPPWSPTDEYRRRSPGAETTA